MEEKDNFDSDDGLDDYLYVYDEDDDIDEDGDDKEEETEDYDDSSPLNYSHIVREGDPQPEEDDDIEAYNIEDSEEDKPAHPSIFLMMLKVLSNPLEGWKDLRRYKITAEDTQRTCFYPLVALVALSNFAQLVYSPRTTVAEVLMEALTSFVGFFAGYFCILILLKILLPKPADNQFETEFGKVFILISLSTLCLFFVLIELFPVLWALLIFLPLWTVYSICRGVRFFDFPDNRSIMCTGLLCVLTVGVPCLIDWGLSEVLPK